MYLSAWLRIVRGGQMLAAGAKAAFEKAKQDADTRSDAEAELAKLRGGKH